MSRRPSKRIVLLTTGQSSETANAVAVILSGSMVKEGYYFGLPPWLSAASRFFFRWTIAGTLLLLLAAFIFYFFRDPDRVIPADAGAIVSPAAAASSWQPTKKTPAAPASASPSSSPSGTCMSIAPRLQA